MQNVIPATDQSQRIDKFISGKFGEARSPQGTDIIRSGGRARALGFGASANTQYADFLQAFAGEGLMQQTYAQAYPDCVFLPWKAFHYTRKALNLWCELPAHYAGGIPDAQLGYIEKFRVISDEHEARESDLLLMLELGVKPEHRLHVGMRPAEYLRALLGFHDPDTSKWRVEKLHEQINQFMYEAQQSLFVVAPAQAFTTHVGGKDWLQRFKEIVMQPQLRPVNPPADPLVVQFVSGGALVVASWGDEAEWLNDAMRQVNGVDIAKG